MAGQSST